MSRTPFEVENLADSAIVDEFCQRINSRIPCRRPINQQLDSWFFRGGNHAICLRKPRRHRFFRNPMNTFGSSSFNNVRGCIVFTASLDDIQLFLFNHFLPRRIQTLDARLFFNFLQQWGIDISGGDNLCVWNRIPVIDFTPDVVMYHRSNTNAIFFRHEFSSWFFCHLIRSLP